MAFLYSAAADSEVQPCSQSVVEAFHALVVVAPPVVAVALQAASSPHRSHDRFDARQKILPALAASGLAEVDLVGVVVVAFVEAA